MGTVTGDIIRLCKEDGLKEPEFIQEADFRTVIWRTLKATGKGENKLTRHAILLIIRMIMKLLPDKLPDKLHDKLSDKLKKKLQKPLKEWYRF